MLTSQVSYLSQMAESFGDRVKRLRLARGMSPQQFADAVGVSRSATVMWESGASGSPDSKNLVRAAEVLGVDPAYLQFGDPDAAEPLPAYAATLVTRPGVLRQIPVIGYAIATPNEDGFFDDMGLPPGAGDGYVSWPTRDPNAYALRVKNDSMAPRIRPGEIIVVEPGGAVSLGDDVLVKTREGRKMVKQLLYRRSGEVTLGSINIAHKHLTISLEEIESMHHIGGIVPRRAVGENT